MIRGSPWWCATSAGLSLGWRHEALAPLLTWEPTGEVDRGSVRLLVTWMKSERAVPAPSEASNTEVVKRCL